MNNNRNAFEFGRGATGGRYRIFLIEAFFLVAVACISGWSGWEAVSVYGDELSLSSQSHLFGLRPSVLFAAGLGLGRVDCASGEFPELEAFMERKISFVPPSAYPTYCGEVYHRNFHFYFHYYLIAYMGWMFRIFGISVWTIHLACVAMHVVAMLCLYLLLRLVMGRLLSLAGTVYVATMPAFLVMLPDFRDYGKAPFFLAALLLMGFILKRARSPWRQLALSTILGVVIGIGYGFRQDLLICMPPCILVVLLGARMITSHPGPLRIVAAVAATAAFVLTAAPVFNGKQESGGFVMTHTLLQGITSSVEGEIGFGGADYDFGFLGLDTPVIAGVDAYALRTGLPYPDSYVSREYGEAGKRLFRETVGYFPADFFARAAAAVEHVFHIPASRFIEETMTFEPYVKRGEWLHRFDRIHAPGDAFFSRYGLICGLFAVFILACGNYRAAFWISFLFCYFAAYPSLLAEFRHLFYLAFIPVFFLGLLLNLAGRRARRVLVRSKDAPAFSGFNSFAATIFRGASLILVSGVIFVAVLSGLRVYQARQVVALLENYAGLEMSPLPYTLERKEGKVSLRLQRTLAAIKGVEPPEQGQVVATYLAARFKKAHRTVTFNILNENDTFSRSCTARLNGGGSYFFPANDFGSTPPAVFTGLEFPAEDYEFFEGLSLVTNADKLALWPFITVPEDKKDFLAWKTSALDRGAERAYAEVVSGFGLFPEKALEVYLQQIPRNPYDALLAGRALDCAQRCGDAQLLKTWETIGIFMPDQRSRASVWIVEHAGAFQDQGALEQAIRYYETALKVMPSDLWNLVRIGEIQSVSGNPEDAIRIFQSILRRAPESPYTAKLLDALYEKKGEIPQAGAFWKELADSYPEAACPGLYNGISLERQANPTDAYNAYVASLTINPGFPPALYRRGALEAERGEMETGVEMMKQAADSDPGLAAEIAERCSRAAKQCANNEQYERATVLYETALEIYPSDLWPRVHLGELYERLGRDDAALSCYREVLMAAPESPATARKMQCLLERMKVGKEAVTAEWKSITAKYPHSAVPFFYLGMTLESTGDYDAAASAYIQALNEKQDFTEARDKLEALKEHNTTK